MNAFGYTPLTAQSVTIWYNHTLHIVVYGHSSPRICCEVWIYHMQNRILNPSNFIHKFLF